LRQAIHLTSTPAHLDTSATHGRVILELVAPLIATTRLKNAAGFSGQIVFFTHEQTMSTCGRAQRARCPTSQPANAGKGTTGLTRKQNLRAKLYRKLNRLTQATCRDGHSNLPCGITVIDDP